MKLPTMYRALCLIALTGVLALGAALLPVQAVDQLLAVSYSQHVLIVDGSESTGKPPKPHGRLTLSTVRTLIADGSESTGKPPKPHNA